MSAVSDPRGNFAPFKNHQSSSYWDAKLSAPKPLISIDIVLRGLDDVRNYIRESGRLGRLGGKQGIMEVERLFHKLNGHIQNKRVVVFGPGLWYRDKDFYHKVNELGFSLRAYDISEVSCNWGLSLMKQAPRPPGKHPDNQIIQADIKELLCRDGNPDVLDPKRDCLIYATEFFQILPKGDMEKIMYHIGLRYRGYPGNLRMVLAHPFRKNNRQPRTWQGQEFHGVKWGDTTPYSLLELKQPLEMGLGSTVYALNMRDTYYYHQAYSAFTLTGGES